jgi:hypothetical protein
VAFYHCQRPSDCVKLCFCTNHFLCRPLNSSAYEDITSAQHIKTILKVSRSVRVSEGVRASPVWTGYVSENLRRLNVMVLKKIVL